MLNYLSFVFRFNGPKEILNMAITQIPKGLTMVKNIQNYWVLDFAHHLWCYKEHNVLETGFVSLATK
jgi:hypothetical protein